ncbi:hypothetical protein O0L34_g17654 [Tuta absoluta]|nr:hypothetical protein O0L34_g17654 [Tuta absoluta]
METKKITMVSFNCRSIKRSVDNIRSMCKIHQIIALQETWLFSHDLSFLNSIDDKFGAYGVSAMDTSAGIIKGRPYGGVAILWDKSVFTEVELIPCDNSRILAVRLCGKYNALVFSVYMPTDCHDNLPEFIQCLGNISAIIESVAIENVFV